MALAPLPVPTFPNVPIAPGVPPVLRAIGQIQDDVLILAADAFIIYSMFLGPQWGIFDQQGQPVLTGDSLISMDFRKGYRVADYPIEPNGFESYNKVETPYDAKMTMSVTGGGLLAIPGTQKPDRTAFLDAVAQACASTYLFQMVTPEVTYYNANLIDYNYRRTAEQGVSRIEVDIYIQEIRQAPPAQFTQTAAVSGADPANDGTVQATAPTTAQSSSLSGFKFS